MPTTPESYGMPRAGARTQTQRPGAPSPRGVGPSDSPWAQPAPPSMPRPFPGQANGGMFPGQANGGQFPGGGNAWGIGRRTAFGSPMGRMPGLHRGFPNANPAGPSPFDYERGFNPSRPDGVTPIPNRQNIPSLHSQPMPLPQGMGGMSPSNMGGTGNGPGFPNPNFQFPPEMMGGGGMGQADPAQRAMQRLQGMDLPPHVLQQLMARFGQ